MKVDFEAVCMRDEHGQRFKNREIDQAIQRHIDECQTAGLHCGILAPSGSGKTCQVIIRALWAIYNDPSVCIKIVSWSDDAAIRRLTMIQRAGVLSGGITATTRRSITVRREHSGPEPTVESYVICEAGCGSRADYLIFDDCLGARSTLESQSLKKQIESKFRNQWMTRITEWGFAIWSGTAWTDDDLSSELLKDKDWRFLTIRVSEGFDSLELEVTEQGRRRSFEYQLLPPGWTREGLEKNFVSLGEVEFNRSYRQVPLVGAKAN